MPGEIAVPKAGGPEFGSSPKHHDMIRGRHMHERLRPDLPPPEQQNQQGNGDKAQRRPEGPGQQRDLLAASEQASMAERASASSPATRNGMVVESTSPKQEQAPRSDVTQSPAAASA